MENDNEQNQRISPLNEIDLTFLTTDPAYGKLQGVPQDYLKQLISNKEVLLAQIEPDGTINLIQDENKKPVTLNEFSQKWARLGYLTKDIRLGNVSRFGGDKHVIEYYLDLAGDCLEAGFPTAHISALQRSAVKLEVSQSIGGFFRKRQGTITSENIINELDPKKNKGFFGGRKEE
jgi:hypothetical protein